MLQLEELQAVLKKHNINIKNTESNTNILRILYPQYLSPTKNIIL